MTNDKFQQIYLPPVKNYVNKVKKQVKIVANSKDDKFILEIVRAFIGNRLGGDRAVTKLYFNSANSYNSAFPNSDRAGSKAIDNWLK